MVRRGGSSGSLVALVALAFFLARRGVTAVVGLALTVACVVGFGALSVVFARRGSSEALRDVPLLASSALAYGVGVLVAFAVSTRMFRRDEDDGVRDLLRARGVGAAGYLAARAVGLAMVLAVLVAGGSAIVGLVTLLVARGRITAFHALQASSAAVVFGLAFAATFAPVAMATLGARSRGGGYLALLAVLGLPEVLRSSLDRVIAPRWLDVLSIPGALLTLRTSLAPGLTSGAEGVFMLGRALLALVAVIAVALLVVRTQLRRAHGTQPLGSGSRRLL